MCMNADRRWKRGTKRTTNIEIARLTEQVSASRATKGRRDVMELAGGANTALVSLPDPAGGRLLSLRDLEGWLNAEATCGGERAVIESLKVCTGDGSIRLVRGRRGYSAGTQDVRTMAKGTPESSTHRTQRFPLQIDPVSA
ncbi:hypothetical protein PM082_009671 [Marasmius tenuissimus]|nr:hypothetical protein PM082_009671 [Marasmius tenuissimus]